MSGWELKCRIVFFDMDHTLMDHDMDVSWKSFLLEKGLAEPVEEDEARMFYEQYLENRLDIDRFLDFQLRQFRGRTPDEMTALAREHFEGHARSRIFPEAGHVVRQYQGEGAHTVLLTATCEVIAGPVAEWFGFDTVVATRLTLREGRYTGKINPPYCYGPHKVDYALDICSALGLNFSEAGYYGDSTADIPLLKAVAFPVAVNPRGELEALAASHGWPIKRWLLKPPR